MASLSNMVKIINQSNKDLIESRDLVLKSNVILNKVNDNLDSIGMQAVSCKVCTGSGAISGVECEECSGLGKIVIPKKKAKG